MTANYADVFEALQSLLSGDKGFATISEVQRRPCEYRSSFALEEITVSFADGRCLSVMFKDLGWHSLDEAGRQAKPEHLYDPLREIEVYRRVLARASLGTACCYGTVVEPGGSAIGSSLRKFPARNSTSTANWTFGVTQLDGWRGFITIWRFARPPNTR
jgi:hypothetical protein